MNGNCLFALKLKGGKRNQYAPDLLLFMPKRGVFMVAMASGTDIGYLI